MARPPEPSHPDQIAQIEKLLEHFEQLETQFQQVREGLTHSHRLATLGTIASIIAHEYNNILTPIVSYGQLALANTNDHEMLVKAVEKALSGAERAAHISSSLLGFAQEADQAQTADVRTTIDDALGCLARDPKKDGIELTIESPDVKVAMTPLNLQQVLVNLMLNAIQAMRGETGSLAITARVKGSLVHIDVADSGPGIPEQIKDRLFEPFVTLRKPPPCDALSEPKGTGLGLCICRDLIRNAGGSITVESEPGKGTVFHLTIPKAQPLLEST